MSAELTFPVERGSVMAFARSIGDPNPIYFDEEYAASSAMALLIAPPTFVQSSAHFDDNYPLRPKIGATRGETTELSTELGLGLHAEQRYDYQRAIRAGEVLRVRERDGRRGRVTAVVVGGCGSLKRSPNTSTGRTNWSSRSEPASTIRQARSMRSDVALKLDELEVGLSFETIVVENLTRTQIVQCAGASGDFNPTAHRRGLHDEGGWVRFDDRSRHVHHGNDRTPRHRSGRRRAYRHRRRSLRWSRSTG